jgi:hypothetical protein
LHNQDLNNLHSEIDKYLNKNNLHWTLIVKTDVSNWYNYSWTSLK